MTDRSERLPRRRSFASVCVLALAIGAGAQASDDISRVNGDVTVAADQSQGKVGTVNGNVTLDDRAVAAAVESVNGNIALGANARAGSAKAVNGAIRLAENALVEGAVESVNGAITLLPGARVQGDLGNVNGTITLDGARIGGLLSSVNGSMLIGSGSVVEGGLLMRKPKGRSTNDRPPRVVIGPGAEVRGTLTFEREVHLYVHDSATIGAVNGAAPARFSGSEPPATD